MVSTLSACPSLFCQDVLNLLDTGDCLTNYNGWCGTVDLAAAVFAQV